MKGRPGLRSLSIFLSFISAALGTAAACDQDTSVRISDDAGDIADVAVVDGAADTATSVEASADSGADGTSGTCPPLKGAPVPVTTCSKTIGNGTDRLLPSAVATDRDGNIVVTGSFYGTVDFGGGPLMSAGDSDAFLVKFDAQCNHLWSKRFGAPQFEGGVALTVDKIGRITVGLSVQGTVDFGGGSLPMNADGFSDIVIAQFDPCGTHRWSKRFGGVLGQDLKGLASDQVGNAVLVGRFVGTIDFGGGPLRPTPITAGGADSFIAKLSPDGNHLWSHAYGADPGASNRGSSAESVVVASDGTIVATGFGRQTIDFGGGPVQFPTDGRHGMWIARFAEDGAFVDAREIDDAIANGAINGADEFFLAGDLTAATDLGTGPMSVDGGATYFKSFIGRFTLSDLGAAWVTGFGTASPENEFLGFRLAAATNELGFSASCRGSVSYGGATPCSTDEHIFIRIGVDGGYHSAVAHPRGPVTTSAPGQFVVAGFKGATPGAPERMTLTKFPP